MSINAKKAAKFKGRLVTLDIDIVNDEDLKERILSTGLRFGENYRVTEVNPSHILSPNLNSIGLEIRGLSYEDCTIFTIKTKGKTINIGSYFFNEN